MKHFSTGYKLFNIILACLQNMTLGGILYGWASISSTLLISGEKDGGPALTPVYAHMIFTIANFANCLGPLFLGVVLDNYGPRICSLLSIAIVAAGCFLFSISNMDHLPAFIPAMCLIAFGGPGVQSSIIHLSNLFPARKATATAFITGSFQLSFIVFLIFDQLWTVGHWTYQQLFLGYCIVCAVNAVFSFFFWPDQPYSYEEVVEVDEIEDPEDTLTHLGHIRLPSVFIHHSEFRMMEKNKKRMEVPGSSKVPRSVSLKDATLLEQLRSTQFILLTVFFLINSFWVNFYIGTFDAQIRDGSHLNAEEQHQYARIFTLVITLGVVGIPLVGACMDYLGFPATSFILIVFGLLWSVLAITRHPGALVLSFMLYSAFRTFFFTFTFAYLADTLGFKYFGVLAGIMFVLGGVLGILQYPLAEFAVRQCVVNPLSQTETCTDGYWPQVNLVMAITIACTLLFSYHDWSWRKNPQGGYVKRTLPPPSIETTSLLPKRNGNANRPASNEVYGTA